MRETPKKCFQVFPRLPHHCFRSVSGNVSVFLETFPSVSSKPPSMKVCVSVFLETFPSVSGSVSKCFRASSGWFGVGV